MTACLFITHLFYIVNVPVILQPSWRHLPHLDDKTMITYRSSDIKLSWSGTENHNPRVCGYVKEGEGK